MNLPWFCIIFFVTFTFNTLAEATLNKKKLPYAIVVGSVYCDICFQDQFSKHTHLIPGASVVVECKGKDLSASFRQETRTNDRGEFRVRLPFSVTKRVKEIKRCSVTLLNINELYCSVATSTNSPTIHLKSNEQGVHIFSAGYFVFKPQEVPSFCNQKTEVQDLGELYPGKSLSPTNQFFLPPIPVLPMLPPLPQLPALPKLPPLPPLPGNANEARSSKHDINLPPATIVASDFLNGSNQNAVSASQKLVPPDSLLPKLPLFPPLPKLPAMPKLPPLPPFPEKTFEAKTSRKLSLATTITSEVPNDSNQKAVSTTQELLPLNSLQPTLPLLPPLLPLNPLEPPSLPAFPFPPFPGLSSSPSTSPSASPSQAPSFPFPLPPFLFPPIPSPFTKSSLSPSPSSSE